MWALPAGIQRYLRIPRGHRRVVAEGLWLSVVVKRHLRRDGYNATVIWLSERQQPQSAGRERIEVAKLVNRAIEAAPWQTNCLERSLVVSWVAGESSLVRRGVLAGAGSEPHKFHAWVEYDGVVINDDPTIGSKYLPFGGNESITADPDAFD